MVRIPFYKKIYYLFLEEIKFQKEKNKFNLFKKNQATNQRFQLNWSDRYIFLNDATSETGFEPHYIYHPAWAARIVKKISPEIHIDISSTLAFCSTLSAFIPVKFYDYRPANLNLSNLYTGKADLTALDFETNSIPSLSCMHVIEHIGLGRYGDPIDPEGDIKALSELKRVVAIGGYLILVVPVGKPKIQWNAHRIYSYELITDYLTKENEFSIEEFSLIPDNAIDSGMLYKADKSLVKDQKYGCGCWVFKKLK